jgi:hypothetical protein
VIRRARSLSALAGGAILGMAFCACGSTAYAQTVRIDIRPLRDAGGINRGLNTQLTIALSHFVSENAAKQISVETVGASKSDVVQRYVLEGDISCTVGSGEDNQRFMMTARLYREGTVHSLIGQWAGTSDSFRYLTTNLRNYPGIHTHGLIGELGSRIIAALESDNKSLGQQWRMLQPRMSHRGDTVVQLIAAGSDHPVGPAPHKGPFRLRVRSADSDDVYAVILDSAGTIRLAGLSDVSDRLLCPVGETAVSKPIAIPSGATEFWIVCRFTRSNIGEVKAQSTECGLNLDEPPIRILDGIGIAEAPAGNDKACADLITEISRKPDAWRIVRFRIGDDLVKHR